MKKTLFLAKALIFILIAILVFTVIVIPVLMTFTTNDRAPSLAFFISNLSEFLPLGLPILLLIVPTLALKSYVSLKLADTNATTFKKEICIYAVVEIMLIIIFITLLFHINASNSAKLF